MQRCLSERHIEMDTYMLFEIKALRFRTWQQQKSEEKRKKKTQANDKQQQQNKNKWSWFTLNICCCSAMLYIICVKEVGVIMIVVCITRRTCACDACVRWCPRNPARRVQWCGATSRCVSTEVNRSRSALSFSSTPVVSSRMFSGDFAVCEISTYTRALRHTQR